MSEEGEVIVEEAVAVAEAESESFNVIDSLKSVLKRSLIYDGL